MIISDREIVVKFQKRHTTNCWSLVASTKNHVAIPWLGSKRLRLILG